MGQYDLKKLQKIYGIEITTPSDTEQDLAREGQSVLYFVEHKGKGFKEKPCKSCDRIFAYSWDVDSIAYCSIDCMKKSLQKLGLTWDTTKPAKERWGRTIPAVVPPDALEAAQTILSATDDTQEVQHLSTSSE